MSKRVVLPVAEPLYTTYHNQGSAGAVLYTNPTIRNWYLNEVMNLCCSRTFLTGTYSSPQVSIDQSFWNDNPYIESHEISMQFIKGCVNPIIREFLDNGYYVFYWGVDDYYIEGKTWFNKRHFDHDALICGYDQNKKTYSIYAYDQNWIYRTFDVLQESFNKGRMAMQKNGVYGGVCGLKATSQRVDFSPERVYWRLIQYLGSSFDLYPPQEQGLAFGTIVHDYLAMYVDKLADGTILYERMDWRVFRLLWEHKKVMYERLQKTEQSLKMPTHTSLQYKQVVDEANRIRLMYASHHMKQRDSVLPIISKMIMNIKKNEVQLLREFVNKMEGVLKL